MTPEQALQLLAQVTETLQTDRKTHMAVVEALRILTEALKKNA